jgi:hypothetical protein
MHLKSQTRSVEFSNTFSLTNTVFSINQSISFSEIISGTFSQLQPILLIQFVIKSGKSEEIGITFNSDIKE